MHLMTVLTSRGCLEEASRLLTLKLGAAKGYLPTLGPTPKFQPVQFRKVGITFLEARFEFMLLARLTARLFDNVIQGFLGEFRADSLQRQFYGVHYKILCSTEKNSSKSID
jgi:hypothetical protein